MKTRRARTSSSRSRPRCLASSGMGVVGGARCGSRIVFGTLVRLVRGVRFRPRSATLRAATSTLIRLGGTFSRLNVARGVQQRQLRRWSSAYVCDVVNELVERGHRVSVIGGDPERMRAELDPRGALTSARSTAEVFSSVRHRRTRRPGARSHDGRGSGGGCSPIWHRAPSCRRVTSQIVVDRRAAEPLSRVVHRGLAEQIAISRFVARRASASHPLSSTTVSRAPGRRALESPRSS